MSELDPRVAWQEIDRVDRRVRRGRWWRVAAALFMAAFLATFYIGLKAYPDTADDLVLPGMLLALAILGLIGWRQRVADRDGKREEERTTWASLGLAVVTIGLNALVLPDNGLTLWVVLAGLLPAVPFAVLAWRIARR
jgi:peptidoglycan/LPS O-acetylase OafA/YrhL